MTMGDAENAAQTPPADDEQAPAAQPAPEPDPAAQTTPSEPDDTGGIAQPDSKYEI